MVLVLIVGLVVSSCGTSSDIGSNAILNAAKATMNAASAKINGYIKLRSTSGSGLSGKFTGDYNFAKQQGNIQLSGMGLPSPAHMIFTSNTMYLWLPKQARLHNVPVKPWVELMLSDLNAVSVAQAGFVFQTETFNPDYLLTAVVHGTPNIDHSSNSSPYKGSVDLDTAIKTTPSTMNTLLKQQVNFTGISQLPVDVWTNATGTINKIEYNFNLANATTGVSKLNANVVVTMGFSDFGTPVHIAIPPSNDVSNLDVILENLTGGEAGEPPGEAPGQ